MSCRMAPRHSGTPWKLKYTRTYGKFFATDCTDFHGWAIKCFCIEFKSTDGSKAALTTEHPDERLASSGCYARDDDPEEARRSSGSEPETREDCFATLAMLGL